MNADNAGFFLIHPDGTVTSSKGLAASLRSAAPERLPIGQAMGLHPDQEALFLKWIDLVAKRFGDMRWDKLAALAPIHELAGANDGGNPVRLAYRKLEDGEGRLAAIAVFAAEAPPARAVERQLAEERQRHKLEIRDLLALAANPPETIGAFLEDARMRLDAARKGWEAGSDERSREFLFGDLHMIKGNAGAFGFENLAAGTQEAEDLLETSRLPDADPVRAASALAASLSGLRAQLDDLLRALRQITGEGQDAMARILKWKSDRLSAAAAAVDAAKLEPPLRALIEGARSLAFLSPTYLLRKYRNLVERTALGQGKEVQFRVTSNTGDVHPESFSRVDEALVHILRNMVDHGIETPAERKAAGKPVAEIGFEYVDAEDRVLMRIRDDGRGMDPDRIADRAVSMGLVTRTEADALDEVGKLGLIFLEGFTTRNAADLISGRGLGLTLAARCVRERGGELYVYSLPGEGARFAIELPHVGKKRLP
jgi:two-component system chemotaxis sensor kinase CheA